ncbi:1,4-alpha-glucan branching protein GlgB [Fretibacterium sp. OH1220_COT-178]|uniref:1,4-alpha-glucan branching protein GlgB n=1 Tax=Fretibacterium sp. OH1220_COT-178 TaxID=2491047 RepID=UPI000F5EE105|nr:1,4-alpha-glucan branching protein GlgB [Fretibacterium sp. OH1220_COT-178]RRD64747.1 1,4-alpha-glucan branching protein GlgB [Fretibacterium sp. OH1220_COT-178]
MRKDHAVRYGVSTLTDYDIFLFKQGTHYTLHDKMGAQRHIAEDGTEGIAFSVWAPNARSVSVVGDFNGWNPEAHPLAARWDGSGIWEGFVPGLEKWTLYKFHLLNSRGEHKDKMDPFARAFEVPPRTASIVHWPDYEWRDSGWMAGRAGVTSLHAPWSVYEVHLGSWKHRWDDGLSLSYRELAEELPRYCTEMGFTAVELLPVMEHPFYGSWGYQTLGYFAPSSRYGSPEDFMALIDALHQSGVAVLLDWVPSHFPTDDFGLARYDGTALYEHENPQKGYHPDWGSYIFNYGRNEVRSFLISSAVYWLDHYHIDGLRIDAVASMLYLDYSRKAGQWEPNVHGGRENLEAISLLQDLNREVYGRFPDVQTVAEESTNWPMVTRPVFLGGLGFGMKWNMGWMHDTLGYMGLDSVFRSYHQNRLTFSICYAFSENFMLALSHDEVVHGKGSLINKMPGDWWQKRANLRLLLGYMWAHPGKKLLFMGGEFGQGLEWNHNAALEWHLLDKPEFRGIQQWVKDLNAALRTCPPLHELDFSPEGFRWVDCTDWRQSVLAWLRKGRDDGEFVLCVCNFTPVPRTPYRVGVPRPGYWREMLNSDALLYGGSGMGNAGGVEADQVPSHGYPQSLPLVLPPLSIVLFHYRTPAP